MSEGFSSPRLAGSTFGQTAQVLSTPPQNVELKGFGLGQDNLTFTDSGYGSGSYAGTTNLAGEVQNIQEELDYLDLGSDFDLNLAPGWSSFGAGLEHFDSDENKVYDDGQSVYSEASILSAADKKSFIELLAADLAKTIGRHLSDAKDLDMICSLLPGMLQEFTLNSRSYRASQVDHDITGFIRRYRGAKVVQDVVASDGGDKTENMTLEEKIRIWNERSRISEIGNYQRPSEQWKGPSESQSVTYHSLKGVSGAKESEMPAIEQYAKLIQSSPTYKTLLVKLERACILAIPNQSLTEELYDKIHNLPAVRMKVSRMASQTRQIIFHVKWKLPEDETYPTSPDYDLGLLVTTTGSASKAQALSCSEYLRQTWPTIGIKVLDLIQQVLNNPSVSAALSKRSLIDGTMVYASQEPELGYLRFNVVGTVAAIVEIGACLSWIGAIVQPAISEEISLLRPSIQYKGLHHFNIEFVKRPLEHSTRRKNGQCWHDLFREAVIVEGFPIPRRPTGKDLCGVEVPLEIMAGLIGTQRVNSYAGKIFIKGFSKLLLPTGREENIVMWHLISSEYGDRVSYLDGMKLCPIEMHLSDLNECRHILGWCSEMKFYAGAEDISYDIENSRLPKATGLLSNASVSFGQLITGAPFIIAPKKSSVNTSRHGYMSKLKWLTNKYIVLWDEVGKRGWLVNGTSALLHLVCTSLAIDSCNEFSSFVVFNTSMLQSKNSHRPYSALQVLLNPENLQLKIHPEGEDYFRFQDYVLKFYETLEKMFDHQMAIASNTVISPRSQLEGWDFTDIAMERDPIYPRGTTLDSSGRSWVDLTRAVHAVTLFGSNFGEIIQPIRSCSEWVKLPFHRYYLAVSDFDLRNIMLSTCGNLDSSPPKLTDGLIWYIPEKGPLECACDNGKGHSDVVQILLPSSMDPKLTEPILPYKMTGDGAFIFGQHSIHEWFWGETGNPSTAPIAPQLIKINSSVSHDSGIGRSISSNHSDQDCRKSPSQELGTQPCTAASNPRPAERTIEGSSQLQLGPMDYKVAIICALYHELAAVVLLFDTRHRAIPIPTADPNSYVFGSICNHNVVATCLPDGEYGTTSAADVAANMRRTFPCIKFCLLVGIGGGVPSAAHDIRLGDIVVSKPNNSSSGVLAYDMKKTLENGMFQLNGYLQPPPRHLRSTLSIMQCIPASSLSLYAYLNEIQGRDAEYSHPGLEADLLYAPSCPHRPGESNCTECDTSKLISRQPRSTKRPAIHYGTIASGNQVMKDATTRDKWGKEYGVLCFEMEAAGIVNTFPSLIIRGICDYCDSHKNKRWQKYAAAAAAAYSKLLLSHVRSDGSGEEASIFIEESDHDPVPLERHVVEGPGVKRRRIWEQN
ncbi:Pfs domain protein [Paecilomyces variotii No. 5]|uniref:Pfs domain protein n=1 Tax=Byssochlamys spectabilis (strain No. 5 / NBRC 109023) TaxID=1356009 RepID=V5FDN0_BYSSN|nr:Pfs domain protein [Paecilomyces variotii No. 5]